MSLVRSRCFRRCHLPTEIMQSTSIGICLVLSQLNLEGGRWSLSQQRSSASVLHALRGDQLSRFSKLVDRIATLSTPSTWEGSRVDRSLAALVHSLDSAIGNQPHEGHHDIHRQRYPAIRVGENDARKVESGRELSLEIPADRRGEPRSSPWSTTMVRCKMK
jgi:hypothetical protein